MCPTRLASIWSKAPIEPRRTDRHGNAIFPLASGAELLREPNRRALAARIATHVSVPHAYFERLYLSALHNFAAFVQLMPASEAHHHAGLGGLLDHSLDVAEKALALRRGRLLPENEDPERISRQHDLWTYAVFSVGICHDVGKVVTDQSVERFDQRGRSLGLWNPWLGPMRDTAYYRMTFVRGREYARHELVAPVIARLILPEAGIAWLGADREAIGQWVAALAGAREAAGAIGTIVAEADARSTRDALGAGGDRPVPSATETPLRDKLVAALRRLIDARELPLNRPGAAGFVSGGELWLVSKRGLDAIRSHLLEHGHRGVPSKNERLMDELQQTGIARANGDRAIWRARIQCQDFDQALTVLRIPLEALWSDPSARPPPLEGSVTAEAPADAGVARASPDAAQPRAAAGKRPSVGPAVAEAPNELAPPEGSLPTPAATPSDARIGPDTRTSPPESSSEKAEPEGFVTWLREGLIAGAFEINQPDAMFHAVPEGLLMVSPRVFKRYAGTSQAEWHYVQMRFFKAKLHRRNRDRTNIITYQVEGKRKTRQIKGVLIPMPEKTLGVTLPEPNTHLTLLTEL